MGDTNRARDRESTLREVSIKTFELLGISWHIHNLGEQAEILYTDLDQVSPSTWQTDGLSAGRC